MMSPPFSFWILRVLVGEPLRLPSVWRNGSSREIRGEAIDRGSPRFGLFRYQWFGSRLCYNKTVVGGEQGKFFPERCQSLHECDLHEGGHTIRQKVQLHPKTFSAKETRNVDHSTTPIGSGIRPEESPHLGSVVFAYGNLDMSRQCVRVFQVWRNV